ncbi:MAG TPA: LapA family protein [Microlunatus sp.]
MTDKQPEDQTAEDEAPATESTGPETGQDPGSTEPGTVARRPDTSPTTTSKSAPPAVNTRTRIGAAWVAVAVAVVVLVLLLVFILQNQDQVTVTFFSATGQFPLGVLLLFGAAGGALLVIVLGVARIIQLRWLARRDRRATSAGSQT